MENNTLTLKNTFFHEIFEFFRDVMICLIIIIIIGFFIVIPFRIDGNSMEDNFHHNEYILIDKFSYLNFETHFADWIGSDKNFLQNFFGNIFTKIPLHIGDPKRGDVVVIKPYVSDQTEYYLKRIIALPWETIRFYDGKIFIKKDENSDFIELIEVYLSAENTNETYLPMGVEENEFTVPEGQYWVMGDNRRHSSDSRGCFQSCDIFGSTHFIPRKDIVGRVLVSFWYFEIFQEKNFPNFGSFSWKVKPRFFDIPSTVDYK